MYSKTGLILDIDNTLTPPRQPLTQEMVQILSRLVLPFHVAAGSHIEILREQFFDPLYAYGFRGRFDAFLSLGGVHYRCDYSREMDIAVVSHFDLRESLGEDEYELLNRVLSETLDSPEYGLSHPLAVIGETITYRGSMVNFCPIGRAKESPEYRRNRDNFVAFDRETGYRQRMLEHLMCELSPLIKEKSLSIVLGGETSFDISVTTRDKAYAVRTLLEDGYERLIFIGDALFEGGNDAPIRQFIENWRGEEPCPLSAVQVNSWRETAERLHQFGFVSPDIGDAKVTS